MEDTLLHQIKLAQHGNREAFNAIVKHFMAGLYATLYNILKNHEDVDDVLQEVFIKVHRSIGSLKNRQAFKSWLYRIAINMANNKIKQRKRIKNYEHTEQMMNPIKTPDKNLENLEQKELKQSVHNALSTLSKDHQLTVNLVELQGFSCVDTAKIMECSPGTVRSRLHYAKQKLYKLLLPKKSTLLKGEENTHEL